MCALYKCTIIVIIIVIIIINFIIIIIIIIITITMFGWGLFRGLKISYVAAAIMFQYYMCRVRKITIVGVVQSSSRSNLKLLVIGQDHDTYNEPVLLKFTWWTLQQKAGWEILIPIKQEHPTSILGKYLFGRQFEI